MAAMKRVALLLCVCLMAAAAAAQDLYELLGVSASASPAQMKKACVGDCVGFRYLRLLNRLTSRFVWGMSSYRKLSLKYHPDKQTVETSAEAREKFVKITNGGRAVACVCEREGVSGEADADLVVFCCCQRTACCLTLSAARSTTCTASRTSRASSAYQCYGCRCLQ